MNMIDPMELVEKGRELALFMRDSIKTDDDGRPSFFNDTTMGASQIIAKNKLILDRTQDSQPKGKNCFTRGFYKFDAFVFHKKGKLLLSDHLNAAPFVTSNFLACLRIFLAVCLIAQSITTIVETSQQNVSLQFISFWNLFLLTVLFSTMAVIQVSHSRRQSNFRMKIRMATFTGESEMKHYSSSNEIVQLDLGPQNETEGDEDEHGGGRVE